VARRSNLNLKCLARQSQVKRKHPHSSPRSKHWPSREKFKKSSIARTRQVLPRNSRKASWSTGATMRRSTVSPKWPLATSSKVTAMTTIWSSVHRKRASCKVRISQEAKMAYRLKTSQERAIMDLMRTSQAARMRKKRRMSRWQTGIV